MRSKKADGGITFILIALLIFIAVWWLVNISHRECNSNKECSSDSYCGSDFSCHAYPNIQKNVMQYNLLWPSIILAIGLITAALILRLDKFMPRKEKEEAVVHHVEHKEPEIKEKGYYEKEYYQSYNPKTP